MSSILGTYPVFSEGWRLHLNPSGSRAFLAVPRGASCDSTDADLNGWATDMALKMNGERSVAEMCELAVLASQAANADYLPEDALLYLVQLINGLAKLSILRLEPGPLSRSVPTSGARDRYSPTHASIELTEYCNLSCRHCYRDSSPARTRFAETARLLGWLEELRRSGVAVVELTGGEPTAHPDFCEILSLSCKLFQLTAVISNGTLWTEQMLSLAAQARDSLIVQIDLDGATAESHDFLRGKSVFEQATQTIARLSARGIPCKVAMSVHGGNAAEIVETAAVAHALGARWFSYGPVLQMGRGHHVPPLEPRHGTMMLSVRPELARKFPGFVYFGEHTALDVSSPSENCGAGWRGVAIGPDGTVRSCVMHSPDHLNFGSLEKHSVADVFAAMPGDVIRNVPAPNFEDCAGCQHISFCAGCSARAVQATEYQRARHNDFVCAWDRKYDALRIYASGRTSRPARSSLKYPIIVQCPVSQPTEALNEPI